MSGAGCGQGSKCTVAGVETTTKGQPKELVVHLDGEDLILIRIPAGDFQMGDPDGKAGTQHHVRITKPFYLSKFPVTQVQWEAVTGNNPSNFYGATRPVERVSWEDCQSFLRKLNMTHGKAGKFGLPSEAQWEYACRAGSNTAFFFGDDPSRLGEYAWYEKNSDTETHPVGEKKPNAWGLHDMVGNLAQWCADWYDGRYYDISPEDDPTGPATGSERVIRGCGLAPTESGCESGARSGCKPNERALSVGLRVKLDPPEQSN
jgi:formylglycine-generating enzyme required for sulfatase activity